MKWLEIKKQIDEQIPDDAEIVIIHLNKYEEPIKNIVCEKSTDGWEVVTY